MHNQPTSKINTLRYYTRKKKKKLSKKITLDMTNSMKLISKRCFSKAIQVTHRLHVQKLALETLQKIKNKYRRDKLWILKINWSHKQNQKENTHSQILPNGDSAKQLFYQEAGICFRNLAKNRLKYKKKEHKYYSTYIPIPR